MLHRTIRHARSAAVTWTPKFDFAVDQDAALKSMQLPIGAVSPLWFAYAGLASLGVGYWWMSQLAKPVNLEAFKGFMPRVEDILAAPSEAMDAVVEMIPEPVTAEPVAFVPEIVEPAAFVAAANEPMVEVVDAANEMVAPALEVAETLKEAAVETTQAVVETLEEVTATVVVDLTKLVGIGPKLSERLADMGVTRFAEIASWTEADLAKFDSALDLKGRAVREAWVAQAKRYAAVPTP